MDADQCGLTLRRFRVGLKFPVNPKLARLIDVEADLARYAINRKGVVALVIKVMVTSDVINRNPLIVNVENHAGVVN